MRKFIPFKIEHGGIRVVINDQENFDKFLAQCPEKWFEIYNTCLMDATPPIVTDGIPIFTPSYNVEGGGEIITTLDYYLKNHKLINQ